MREECTHAWYVYPVLLDHRQLEGVHRGMIARALEAEGVPVGEGYVEPIYLQPLYQQRIAHGSVGCPWTCGHWHGTVSYERGICPTTERLHDRDLLLLDVTRVPLRERTSTT